MGSQEEATERKKACILCGKEFSGNIELCPEDGTLLTPISREPKIGDIFAERYEILGIIGDGGMGKVYKARHNLMKRIVAIKMLLPHLVQNAAALKRFTQEAQAASALKHPHILYVHDFGISEQGIPFLVMDYLEGINLATLLQEEGSLPESRAVPIFIQACSALAHAHSKGVVHRDIKPANIMLIEYEGQPDYLQIVDFGIAKLMQPDGAEQLTHTGEVFGSPLYMSPEQCRGKDLDARSDIYSLGCVLYRCLTGRPVFGGRDAMECMYKQVNDTPSTFHELCPEVKISESLEAAVFKAIAKEPEDRFQTMPQFREALEAARGVYPPVNKVFSVPPESDDAVPLDAVTDRLKRHPELVQTQYAGPAKQPSDAEQIAAVSQSQPAADSQSQSAVSTSQAAVEVSSITDPAKSTWDSAPSVSSTSAAVASNDSSTPVPAAGGVNKNVLIGVAVVAAVIVLGISVISMSGKHDPDATTTGGNTASGLSGKATTEVAKNDYQSAEKTLDKAAKEAKNENELLQVLLSQAKVYEESDKYLQAGKALKDALAIQEKNKKVSKYDIARTKANLAVDLLEMEETSQAEPLLNDAEKVLAAAPPEEQRGLSHVYYGLSKVARYGGNMNKAVQYLLSAIEIKKKSTSPDPKSLVQYMLDLSEIYIVQGKLPQSESNLQEILQICKDNLGADSPQEADALKDLAYVQLKKGKPGDAEPMLTRSLEINSKDFGPDSLSAAEVMATLAMCYTQERKYAQAAELFKHALDIRTKELGADSPQAQRTKELYATLQKKMKGSKR